MAAGEGLFLEGNVDVSGACLGAATRYCPNWICNQTGRTLTVIIDGSSTSIEIGMDQTIGVDAQRVCSVSVQF